MRYCIRTVTWRFKESIELDPEFVNKRSVVIRSPSDVFENYQSLFKDQVRERFVVLWMNSAKKVIGFEIISEGILNSSLTHPREVFRVAGDEFFGERRGGGRHGQVVGLRPPDLPVEPGLQPLQDLPGTRKGIGLAVPSPIGTGGGEIGGEGQIVVGKMPPLPLAFPVDRGLKRQPVPGGEGGSNGPIVGQLDGGGTVEHLVAEDGVRRYLDVQRVRRVENARRIEDRKETVGPDVFDIDALR